MSWARRGKVCGIGAGEAWKVLGGVLKVSEEGGRGHGPEGRSLGGAGEVGGARKGPRKGPEKSGSVGNGSGWRSGPRLTTRVRAESAEGSQRGFRGEAARLPVMPGPGGPQREATCL